MRSPASTEQNDNQIETDGAVFTILGEAAWHHFAQEHSSKAGIRIAESDSMKCSGADGSVSLVVDVAHQKLSPRKLVLHCAVSK